MRSDTIMSAPPCKKRRSNFTSEELLALIMEVTERKTALLGKLDSRVTREGKNMTWLAVVEAVNAVGFTRRTEDEVKKRFRDFRSIVKKKVSDARQEMLRTGKPFIVIDSPVARNLLVSCRVSSGIFLNMYIFLSVST